MAKDSNVQWYGGKVVTQVQGASAQLLVKIAEQALGRARINLRDSGRVDTGFLINSGYVAGSAGTEVDGASAYNPHPQYKPKPNEKRPPVAAPQSTAPQAGAVVGFSAEYALWQEFYKSYLMTGLQAAAKDAGKIAKALGQ